MTELEKENEEKEQQEQVRQRSKEEEDEEENIIEASTRDTAQQRLRGAAKRASVDALGLRRTFTQLLIRWLSPFWLMVCRYRYMYISI